MSNTTAKKAATKAPATVFVKNTAEHPLKINRDKRMEGGRLDPKAAVTLPPKNVTVRKEFGPGVVRLPLELWEELKVDKRVKARVGKSLFVIDPEDLQPETDEPEPEETYI